MKIKNMINFLDKHDKSYSRHIHSLEVSRNIEMVIYCLARMFNPDLIFCYFMLMIAISYNSNIFFFIKPLFHTLISLLISTVIKKLTARLRPEKLNKSRLYDLRQHEKNFSMPSGDSLQAANFAVILLMYYNTWLGFLLIPLVMFARIFYFCHYILDTIAGSTMGLIISYITYLLIN